MEMAWAKSTWADSTVPSMGAAREALGVQTSGIWPSPANRPEVGSIPIQPAPGKNASAQAWKSAESFCGAARTLGRALLRRHLNEISGDEACRDSQMSQNLHQQPSRVAARAGTLCERLLARLDARIEPRHIVDFVSHPPIQIDQETDRSALLVRKLPKKTLEPSAGRLDREIGFKILGQLRRILRTGSPGLPVPERSQRD